MMKKILAALAALVLTPVAVVAMASPASAHNGAVTGTPYCNDNGSWGVVWTFRATNVPNGREAEVKAMTTSAGQLAPEPGHGVNKGGQVFLSVWREHQVNVPGAPVRTGNWSDRFSTVNIPATTSGVTTMVQYDFKGGPSGDPVGSVSKPSGCQPKDACPELSGNQPPGTVCTPPADNVEHRTLSTTPTCKNPTVTTSEQERHQGYVWDGDSFELGPWSDWVTTSSWVTTLHDGKCSQRAHVRFKVTDECNCYRDKVHPVFDHAKVRVERHHPSSTVWRFKAIGRVVDGIQYLLPSRIGGSAGWSAVQWYTVKTKNQVCPCVKRGDCHHLYPHFTPPPGHCRTTKNGHC